MACGNDADKLAEIVAEGREAYDTNWRQRDIAERRLLIIGPDITAPEPGTEKPDPDIN